MSFNLWQSLMLIIVIITAIREFFISKQATAGFHLDILIIWHFFSLIHRLSHAQDYTQNWIWDNGNLVKLHYFKPLLAGLDSDPFSPAAIFFPLSSKSPSSFDLLLFLGPGLLVVPGGCLFPCAEVWITLLSPKTTKCWIIIGNTCPAFLHAPSRNSGFRSLPNLSRESANDSETVWLSTPCLMWSLGAVPYVDTYIVGSRGASQLGGIF